MESSSGKPRILIIEDDMSLAEMYTKKLTEANFSVTTAKDGYEGLTEAISFHPDLIILDLALPKMGGMDIMKSIRHEKDWGKNVPIIILTNLDPNDAILKGVIEDQPSYYLIKSNTVPDSVLAKVQELLPTSTKEN